MKITVTIKVLPMNQSINIQMDQKQRIKTTLRVLAENRMEFLAFENSPTIRIEDSGRRISTEQTYEEACIYSGAILLLEMRKN